VLEKTVWTVVTIQVGKAEELAVTVTAVVAVTGRSSDGFNNNHSFARMCNGKRFSDYDGGVWPRTASRRSQAPPVGAVTVTVIGAWGCTNTARGAACGGSNSGGIASSIRDSMSVDGTVRGDSSGHGGDEARDAAGEALVVGIGVAFG